jgi:RNA polymerase II subunit A small phosphatase-like protein
LPPRPGLPLLILDLDETLVHAVETPREREPDFQVGPYHVYERPHVRPFLIECASLFRLAVWTSATSDFARAALAHITPAGVDFAFVWSRERCTRRRDLDTQETVWVKDLKKVKRRGYPLERVLMVDDTPAKLARQYGNLVRIRPFFGDPQDDELPALATYLTRLREEPNYRRVEKRGWRSRWSPGKAPGSDYSSSATSTTRAVRPTGSMNENDEP